MMEESYKDPKIMRHVEASKHDLSKGKEDKDSMYVKKKKESKISMIFRRSLSVT